MRTFRKVLVSLAMPMLGCPAPQQPQVPPDSPIEADVLSWVDICGWGEQVEEPGAMFVRVDAEGEPDGTRQHPYARIQDALDAAAEAETTTVFVGRGAYQEGLVLQMHHAGRTLRGCGRDLTFINASDGGTERVGVEVDLAWGSPLTISDMTVTNADSVGISVLPGHLRMERMSVTESGWIGVRVLGGATLTATDCEIVDNEVCGVLVAESSATIRNCEIARTRPATRGDYIGEFGYGIRIQDGAQLEMSECEVAENTGYGIKIENGSEASLTSTRILDTASSPSGTTGDGIYLGTGELGGTGLHLDTCTIQRNRRTGIRAFGTDEAGSTTLHVVHSSITDTSTDDNGDCGGGIFVAKGVYLEMQHGSLERNACQGVFLQNESTSALLEQVTISENTVPTGYGFPAGAYVKDGSMTLSSCTLSGNTRGVVGRGETSYTQIIDSTINDSQVSDSDVGAVLATLGALIEISGSTLIDNVDQGLWATGEGSWLQIEDSEILNMVSAIVGDSALAAVASDGGTVVAAGVEISGTCGASVLAVNGGSALLSDVDISGNLANVYGGDPVACAVCAWAGSELEIEASRLTQNENDGISIMDAGTTARIIDSTITWTGGSGERSGAGLTAWNEALMEIESCTVENTMGVGISSLFGARTTVNNTTVSSTLWDYDHTFALGVYAYGGSVLDATGLVVEDTQGPGLWAEDEGRLSCATCLVKDAEAAGAVARYGGILELEQTTIQGTSSNANTGGGLGVWAYQGDEEANTVDMTDVSVWGNSVGGLWFGGGGLFNVADCSIHGADHRWYGDAVYVTGPSVIG